MDRRRKIAIGLWGCAFVVLILLIAVAVIAPIAADTQMVKARVRSELEKAAGIEIDFKHLILEFFPHP